MFGKAQRRSIGFLLSAADLEGLQNNRSGHWSHRPPPVAGPSSAQSWERRLAFWL